MTLWYGGVPLVVNNRSSKVENLFFFGQTTVLCDGVYLKLSLKCDLITIAAV